MLNGRKSYSTCSLNSRCHWLMAGNSMTVTGTLVHSYFLLPDLWVCKPCTILGYATYETSHIIKNLIEKELCSVHA